MFLKHQLKDSDKCGSKGFSLIEVAIALLIISITMAAMIHTYNIYAITKRENDTKNRISVVQASLSKYLEYYGHYPRPADRNIPIGNPRFGKEAAIPTTDCTVSTATSCRSSGGGTVYIGDVPFAALGISYKNIVDAYGSKLTYAVTEAQTRGVFNNTAGAIQVLTVDNGNQFAGTVLDPLAHFIVFSSGEDRRGAYSPAGIMVTPCGAAAAGTDIENCNGDVLFRSNIDNVPTRLTYKKYLRNFANGADHFDDIAGYQNNFSSSLWKMTPNLGTLSNGNDGGNVLVGLQTIIAAPGTGCTVNSPLKGCIQPPRTRVEVVGSLKATELRVDRLCHNMTMGCPLTAPMADNTISPLHYAGTPNTLGAYDVNTQGNKGGGILCANKSALRGFANSGSTSQIDETCTSSVPVSNITGIGGISPTDCAAGKYAAGRDSAGIIICQ